MSNGLRQHQLDGVEFCINTEGGAIIGDEMGTGKTRLTLAYAKYLLFMKKVDVVVVVAPASILENWRQEVIAYLEQEPHVYHGSKRKLKPHWFYITSYEVASKERVQLNDFLGDKILLIVDEAHVLKNPDSKRSIEMCGYRCKYRVGLTGTPISNRPEDLFGLLYFINRDLSGTKAEWWSRFILSSYKEINLKRGGRRYIPVINGYKNLDQLHKMLESVMIRRLKKDCLDLPKTSTQYISYQPTDMLYRNVLAQTEVDDETVMVKIIRLQFALSGLDPYTEENKSFIPGEKFKLLKTLLEGASGRCIVWFSFEQTLQAVQKTLALPESFTHTGKMSKAAKTKALDAWRQSDCGVLFATIRSAGLGLNLVEANTAFFYEMELSPSQNAQAEARIDRQGQTAPTTNYYLFGKDSVEEAIRRLLSQKSHANRAVVDDFNTRDLDQIYQYSFKVFEREANGKREN